MAGAALGAPLARFPWQSRRLEQLQAGFAWQVQHLEHLHRGPRKCLATIDYIGRRFVFAWQVQHLEHLWLVFRGSRGAWSSFRLVLRGRCSTWSTFIEGRGSPATIDYSFCVAGAALGAPLAHFEWQAQHLEHLYRGPRKSGDD